jgi:hypothetical protein
MAGEQSLNGALASAGVTPPAGTGTGTGQGGGGAASSAPPALPSLNPTDSPYSALTLPDVPAPAQHELPPQQDIPNLGAVSKAGAIAHIADGVLRGAIAGYDQRQAHKAAQTQKKMQALDTLQKQLGQQYVQAYNDVGSSSPNMTPEQIIADPKVKALRNQLLAVHQATLSALQNYMPQLADQGAGSQPGQPGQSGGKSAKPPKKNLLERMFSQQPDESLGAYYQAASKLGPTAFYQVATPAQLAALHQQRQGAASSQSATASTADFTGKVAAAKSALLDAETKGDQPGIARAKQTLQDLAEASSPSYLTKTVKQYRQDPKTGQWLVSEALEDGTPVANSEHPLSTAGLQGQPKQGWFIKDGKWTSQLYDSHTNQPMPDTVDSTKAPPAWLLQLYPHTTQTTNFYVDNDGNRQGVQVTNTSQREVPAGVIPHAEGAGAAAGAPTATTPPAASPAPSIRPLGPVGYVGSLEYKQLVKNATTAQKTFADASTNYKAMLASGTAAAKGDGEAQVAVIANYLKTVVGGQGSGVRITKAEWDAVTATRPFLQGIQAHFSPDGYMTGAAISPKQITQMIEATHNKVRALWDTSRQLQKQTVDQSTADKRAGGLIRTPTAEDIHGAETAPPPASTFNIHDYPIAK